MTITNRKPLRFSLLTVAVWLAVAIGIIFLLWQVINRISDRNLPVSTATPNLTQVYQTITVILVTPHTSTATSTPKPAVPSPSIQATEIPSTPLPSPMTTTPPGGVTQTSQPEVPCDRAAAGNPIDITIPDDTAISAGDNFIKTWKLVNSGTCTWTSSYSTRFFYGDRMNAPESVPLQGTILPGGSIEISIEMVAPLEAGTYQGNWKLSNQNGILFGIGPNGDSPFWVRIIVPQNPSNTATATPSLTATPVASDTPTVTVTPTVTATPTITEPASPTPTNTPPIQASGKLSPIPGDAIDLDTLTLNGGDSDLTYQMDANNFHWLTPNGATIGIYGNVEPALSDCQNASMSSAPIAVESVSIGTYICYKTNEGRFGQVLLEAVNLDDFSLTLDLLTWGLP